MPYITLTVAAVCVLVGVIGLFVARVVHPWIERTAATAAAEIAAEIGPPAARTFEEHEADMLALVGPAAADPCGLTRDEWRKFAALVAPLAEGNSR